MSGLKPFWRYYGGKWRAAPRYPAPIHDTIIEPFAGAAGYSMRYPHKNIILVEKYSVVAGIWRYLISVKESEIHRIPFVEHVDDLPSWVPGEARNFVGFSMNAATVSPCRQLSSGRKKLRSMGRKYEGWSEALKHRIASQLQYIRHWKIVEDDYANAPDTKATWFIDPPYNNKAGSYYVVNGLDYSELADFCRNRQGQTIVCENEGADWLPFRPFATLKAGLNGTGSREVIWTNSSLDTASEPSNKLNGNQLPQRRDDVDIKIKLEIGLSQELAGFLERLVDAAPRKVVQVGADGEGIQSTLRDEPEEAMHATDPQPQKRRGRPPKANGAAPDMSPSGDQSQPEDPSSTESGQSAGPTAMSDASPSDEGEETLAAALGIEEPATLTKAEVNAKLQEAVDKVGDVKRIQQALFEATGFKGTGTMTPDQYANAVDALDKLMAA